jgi:hypothetical protein
MMEKVELRPRSPRNGAGSGWMHDMQGTIDKRLTNLRRERRLVERAIQALTEIAQTRHLRARRPIRTNLPV